MKIFEKQPVEILDFFFDFRNWLLAKEDTPASYVLEASSGLTVQSHEMIEPGVVQVYLAGGSSGTRYKVTCRMSTGGGRIKEAEFYCKVKDA